MLLVEAQLQPLPCSDIAAFHYVRNQAALPRHTTTHNVLTHTYSLLMQCTGIMIETHNVHTSLLMQCTGVTTNQCMH